MPTEPGESRIDEDRVFELNRGFEEGEDLEYRTLREPFTPTGEAFSVPLSTPIPEYPTLQETMTVTNPERATERSTRGRLGPQTRGGADPVSIGAGLVFLLLGGAYLLASGGHLNVNAGWTLSFLLLGLGSSGVVGTYLRARRDRRGRIRADRDEW